VAPTGQLVEVGARDRQELGRRRLALQALEAVQDTLEIGFETAGKSPELSAHAKNLSGTSTLSIRIRQQRETNFAPGVSSVVRQTVGRPQGPGDMFSMREMELASPA
jgi:hypothetical protein